MAHVGSPTDDASGPLLIMEKLSVQEAELYDRQIRLWGAEAQQRIRGSTVLIYGMNALGAEVSKNAVLAGWLAFEILSIASFLAYVFPPCI